MDLKGRLRYRFDNVMARGVGAQILLLAAITAVIVLVATAATVAFGVQPPADDQGHAQPFGTVVWISLMHSLDAGTVAGDPLTSWTYLWIMLVVTIGGVFVVSALIGVLTTGFGQFLENLRRGRSRVVEQGHTIVLGWNSTVFPLLAELAEANRNVRRASVVVLADRDKVEMDEEIAAALGRTRLRVVTRRGSALTVDDVRLASPETAKAVVVLAPERHPDGSVVTPAEADTVVLSSLLALDKLALARPLHLVAQVADARTQAVARTVVGDRAALLLTSPLISRLLVQTGRQSGLSVVYGDLLDFAGSEIYVVPRPELAGTAFGDAVLRFGTSTLLGVLTADDVLLLPPPADHVLGAGDLVVVLAEDDDRILLDGSTAPDEAAIVDAVGDRPRLPERTLVLGTSDRLPVVLRELDANVAPGSTAVVVGEGDPGHLPKDVVGGLANLALTFRSADITDRDVLESLDLDGVDHVLLLAETADRSQALADARTTVTLLHLRDITRGTRKVPVTSEILDIRNRDLVASGHADDFIVSNRLVSLVVSQIAENPHLVRVFDELLGADGHEVYLRPAADYVTAAGTPFATVCGAALRRGEIAFGYRLGAHASDAERAFGVVLNPPKSATVALGPDDHVVVLAEH